MQQDYIAVSELTDLEPLKHDKPVALAVEEKTRKGLTCWSNAKLAQGVPLDGVNRATRKAYPYGVPLSAGPDGSRIAIEGSFADVHRAVDNDSLASVLEELGQKQDAERIFLKIDDLEPAGLKELLRVLKSRTVPKQAEIQTPADAGPETLGILLPGANPPKLLNIDLQPDTAPETAGMLLRGLAAFAGGMPHIRLNGAELRPGMVFSGARGAQLKAMAMLLANRAIPPGVVIRLLDAMNVKFTREAIAALEAWQEENLGRISPSLKRLHLYQ